MKNAQSTTTHFQSMPTKIYHLAFRVLAVLAMMALCISCPPKPPGGGGGPDVVDSSPDTVHLAFAGGGWRAHTGHAAWTMSLLDGGTKTLDSVFTNVGTISSNSGGSWFSTMLMFSGDFVQMIEAPEAVTTWDSTGWLGLQKHLFNSAEKVILGDTINCNEFSGDTLLLCVAEYYTDFSAGYWDKVVEDVVFADYPLNGQLLEGAHQPWAADKNLLLAATMLTTEVVLNDYDEFWTQFYEACLSPYTPVLNGEGGASCSGGTISDVTPVTFSSIPGSLDMKAPPFLSAAGSGSDSPLFNLGYTQNASGDASTATASVQNPLANDEVEVVVAAAASSAAGGFLASKAISGSFDSSYYAEDEALSFQLANSKVEFVDVANGIAVDQLAARKTVKIADGGPVDNSGVAQLVSFLQLNNKADNFSIVAFDNVQQPYVPGGSAAVVGPDISSLFGLGICPDNTFCADLNCSEYCIRLPDVQVFDSTAIKNTSVTWRTPPGNPGQQLYYTAYSVVTVANSTLGIKGGTKGTLHAFTCVWEDANTAPMNSEADFDAYAEMLNFINNGLLEQDGEGLAHLQAALGLKE